MKKSDWRQQGRDAFTPGKNPIDVGPYSPIDDRYDYFYEGWHDARREYEREQKIDKMFEEVSPGCPWNRDRVCDSTKRICERKDCAAFHMLIYIAEV